MTYAKMRAPTIVLASLSFTVCDAFLAPASPAVVRLPSARFSSSPSANNVAAPTSTTASPRKVKSTEKFARLPVWPVWSGVALFFLSKLIGEETAAKVEDAIGGRVCPNFFNPPESTSPFIMLVHHRHSFAPWDPIRYIQRTFFPEGFPAHPHRYVCMIIYACIH